jgi:hypothetical protein
MRKVETSILINQPASKIFDAFTDPNQLKVWWKVEKSRIEKKQGGLYSLAWGITENGFRYIYSGIITVYQPFRELFIDHFVYFNPDVGILGPTWFSILLEETNHSTALHQVLGGYQTGNEWDWFYHSVTDASPKILQMLKNFLELKPEAE